MGWGHYQTADNPPPPKKTKNEKESTRLVGDYFNFSNLVPRAFTLAWGCNFSRFHIFLSFNYPFRKKLSLSQNAQTWPKNLHKTAKQWLMR